MTIIATLPPAPSRTDPSTFSAKSDALLGALDGFVSQTNLVAGEVNTNAATATTQAGLATTNGAAQVALAAGQVTLATTQAGLATTNGATQVALAATQAVNAATSATAAAGSALVAGAVVWVSGTTYAVGDARYSPINFQTYRRTTAGAGTTDPSLDSTNWTKAIATGGISAVTTATGITTLTNSPTLLSITPAVYGVTVTLPDATTCPLGGPLHRIYNAGAYPVRLLNSTGTLIGFVFAGVTSDVSLVDKSTAAGGWDVSNVELVGASAQLLTTNMVGVYRCVAIDSNREFLLGGYSTGIYGVVYDKSSNTFGSVTLIRTSAYSADNQAILSGTNQILVVSIGAAPYTALEAVTLTISGTAITVNTAATATLSAAQGAWANGCGLIAVGSSFVTSYTVATPAAQIRALSVSGTTVTIGAANVLDGTAGGLIAAATNHVIAASSATTHLYTKPYLVSGSTLTAGTGTDTGASTVTLGKLAALGTRWVVLFLSNNYFGGVITLNPTGNGTTTISTATLDSSGASISDAIIIGTTKVLYLSVGSSSNANLLTDTAGTASAGTAITLSNQTNRACAYVTGTDVIVGETTGYMHVVDCSGASPVKTKTNRGVNNGNGALAFYATSNSVLSRSPSQIYGANFAQVIDSAQNSDTVAIRFQGKSMTYQSLNYNPMAGFNLYRGVSDAQNWIADAATVITKLECVQ